MKIQRFEDIIAWQKAQDLAVDIYSQFSNSKDYGFKEQITRAVVSISNNIAEGFDRCSDAEFKRFLFFSLGSCSEVRSMLYLAVRLNYVTKERHDKLSDQTFEISRMIRGLIKSLKQ
jgi:four helix bundle protein